MKGLIVKTNKPLPFSHHYFVCGSETFLSLVSYSVNQFYTGLKSHNEGREELHLYTRNNGYVWK